MGRDGVDRRQDLTRRIARGAPPEADTAPLGRSAERVILAASSLLIAAFWIAPLLGVPLATAALAATIGFGASVAALVRELRARRGRWAAQRETLAELRLSRRRFKLVADHSADMIVEADRDMVRRFVSPASLSVLGYRPEELVGATAMEIVHPDDREGYRAKVESLLDGTRERVVTTQRYRRKDGAFIWTESNIQVVRHPVTGEPESYVGSLRDVTERHLGEVAVRSSEAFLRGVIEASPDCVKVLDLDGQLTFMSRNGLCLLDFDREDQVVGRDFADLWPSNLRPDVRSAIAAATAGASSRFRARCASAKGRPLQLDVVITPIAGADGRPERLLALSRDVTASAEAEAALGRVQERYRLLAENSSDVVMLQEPGPDGATLYVSPSSTRVLGHPPETLSGRATSAIVHPDDRAGVRALLERLRPEDGIVLQTHRLRRADGVHVWVEGAFQLAAWSGEPTVVVALRDVTERRQRAEDLAAAKEMAERARRSAEQASEAKSEFLAAMSHEIRTPLNSIIGFTDLMIDSGELPDASARHAELIRAAGGALLTVVNDVLDFSKVEAGAVELEALPFSPEALARQCAGILRGYAGTKAIDIEVVVEGPAPASLVGDEGRLRQVLLNLLNNAVKFTPHGRVTLRLSGLGPGPGGEAVRFEVTDTGIGIPERKLHRLFERFSQVDSSVARRFGGSGLGLAICKGLVELMGGEIGVSSREGQGSTFWFTVTLAAAARPAAPAAPPAPAGPRRPARILVAEDIDINRRLAVALLEAGGHAVDVVADGAEAVSAAAAQPYDLVLMDVQMPGMDGVTATRLIRRGAGPWARVPIVAMTANVFPEQVSAFRDAGMDDHLGKPLNRGQLLAAVERWTGRALQAASGGSPEAAARPVAFDADAHAMLLGYLGPARLDDVLARFAASIPARFARGQGSPEDVQRWAADAHVVVAIAGMAGFADLAANCRALEAAAPGSEAYDAALAAVRASRDDAVARVGALRRSLAATSSGDAA